MNPYSRAAEIITSGIQTHIRAAGPLPTDATGDHSPRITGLAVAIMGDLLDAGWSLPDVEPVPDDIDRPGWPQPRPAGAPDVYRDLDYLAELQYRMGVTTREWATKTIALHITLWATVCAGRAADPASYPGYWPDTSIEAMSTRLVGTLMGGGWLPPADIFATFGEDGTP
jgi:hypothetical protein